MEMEQYPELLPRDRQQAFETLYTKRYLGEYETISGRGATLMVTANLRHTLARLIAQGMFKTILDVGCGDFNWQSVMDWSDVDYTGIDISPSCIRDVKARHERSNMHFAVSDIVEETPATYDLVLCRDVFNYLGYWEIGRSLALIKDSGSRYFAATSHVPELAKEKLRPYYHQYLNYDNPSGYWTPGDLTRSPFYLPPPLLRIVENIPGKMLDIWKLDDLPYLLPQKVAKPELPDPRTPEDFMNYAFFQALTQLPFVQRIALAPHAGGYGIELVMTVAATITREQGVQVADILDAAAAEIPLPIACSFAEDASVPGMTILYQSG